MSNENRGSQIIDLGECLKRSMETPREDAQPNPEPKCPCSRCGTESEGGAFVDGLGNPICNACGVMGDAAGLRAVPKRPEAGAGLTAGPEPAGERVTFDEVQAWFRELLRLYVDASSWQERCVLKRQAWDALRHLVDERDAARARVAELEAEARQSDLRAERWRKEAKGAGAEVARLRTLARNLMEGEGCSGHYIDEQLHPETKRTLAQLTEADHA